ncbi:MAG: T9SS type A sorting domain-containing protein [Bacteroidia bacterium]|nr:T9SS type A sorting domain-containing protein [Bacteroidia bacterium]
MKKILTLAGLLVSAALYSQHLVSHQFLKSYDNSQIDSIYSSMGLPSLLLPNQYKINVYRLLYNTVGPDSVTPVVASGLMVLPKDKGCASTILSYQHGTMTRRVDAPSYRQGEWILGVAMGSDGYVGLLPDYLGLGLDTSMVHPYQHARSEATAVIDHIRAAREACAQLSYALNGQVLLTGYSQGGHATMATHKMIQGSFSSEFNVTASVPMSGPYSMSGVMKDVMLSSQPYPSPYYLPYVLFSFRNVYGVYPNASDFLVAPYDAVLPPLFNGVYGSGTIDNAMPNVPKNILKQTVLDSFTNDPNHIFRLLLDENDVYKWVPQVPVHMLYCEGDNSVPFENTIVAYDYMTNAGATKVSKNNINSALDHYECAQFAMLEMRTFFDPLRMDKVSLSFSTVPPSNAGAQDGAITVHVSGAEPPYTISWNTGGSSSTLTGIGTGTYTVTVSSPSACAPVTASYFVNPMGVSVQEAEKTTLSVFPNPTTGLLNIQSETMIGEVEIYDTMGKKVYASKENSTQVALDLQALKPGVYMVVAGQKEPARIVISR